MNKNCIVVYYLRDSGTQNGNCYLLVTRLIAHLHINRFEPQMVNKSSDEVILKKK